ncbi:MAG: carbohydrate-binding domain-containing protein [Prevotellaceae bacterium]|nr:carbohydrate-binding domain-containing protein [Prevotellaceae bacterium]
MKRSVIFTFICCCLALVVTADTLPTKFYVWRNGSATEHPIGQGELTFADGSVSIDGIVYSLAEIDSITFCEPSVNRGDVGDDDEEDDEGLTDADTLYVTYSSQSAEVTPLVSGVTAYVEGADVSITNDITDRELVFILQGQAESGSFVYDGNYKTTLVLAGLTLTGSSAEALNIRDGKRISLVLADGMENTLADAAQDGGQKAALYTKGHMEVSGGGTLNIRGNVKHAISTKEYLLVKKTAGVINITGAASDGIHAEQYVQINGGQITISGVGGDGIQAELKGDGSEDDGKIIVKGGTIDVSLTADDCAALKSDSTLHIKDGSITVSSTGSADKALKSKLNVSVEGGSLSITQSGSYIVEDGDPSYTTGIKADTDIDITGGSITINNSADAGKGISADGDLSVSELDGVVSLSLTCTGEGSALDTSKTAGSSSDTDKSYVVYVNIPSSSSSGGGIGGGGIQSGAWSGVYLCDSSGAQVAQLTQTVTLQIGNTQTTFYAYDFGQSDSGTYYFASDNYKSQAGGMGGSGGTTYAIRSATFTGPTSGSPYFYVISSSYTTSGTTRTYSISDQTSTYSSYLSSSSSSSSSRGETVKATALRSDGNIALIGGRVEISTSGAGGKGIRCDGSYTQGEAGTGEGPQLTVTTTGSRVSTSGSSSNSSGGAGNFGGNFGGNIGGNIGGVGNMDSGSGGSAAKAIKAKGAAYVYGGTTEIQTSQDGAEGLESKTAIYIEGGQHYFQCYDDCLNSDGSIVFDGGITVCYSFGNDGVDSNAGTRGAITIGDGSVFAYSTIGSPEEGLDCDSPSNISITGSGIAVSAGGSQNGGGTISGASQGYAFVTSSVSYATGRYYTLASSSGENLVTFQFAANCSSSLSLFTAPGMASGSHYTISYGTSAPTDALTSFHGLWLGSSAAGTSSVTSFTAK